jgi:hypothetical protein
MRKRNLKGVTIVDSIDQLVLSIKTESPQITYQGIRIDEWREMGEGETTLCTQKYIGNMQIPLREDPAFPVSSNLKLLGAQWMPPKLKLKGLDEILGVQRVESHLHHVLVHFFQSSRVHPVRVHRSSRHHGPAKLGGENCSFVGTDGFFSYP